MPGTETAHSTDTNSTASSTNGTQAGASPEEQEEEKKGLGLLDFALPFLMVLLFGPVYGVIGFLFALGLSEKKRDKWKNSVDMAKAFVTNLLQKKAANTEVLSVANRMGTQLPEEVGIEEAASVLSDIKTDTVKSHSVATSSSQKKPDPDGATPGTGPAAGPNRGTDDSEDISVRSRPTATAPAEAITIPNYVPGEMQVPMATAELVTEAEVGEQLVFGAIDPSEMGPPDTVAELVEEIDIEQDARRGPGHIATPVGNLENYGVPMAESARIDMGNEGNILENSGIPTAEASLITDPVSRPTHGDSTQLLTAEVVLDGPVPESDLFPALAKMTDPLNIAMDTRSKSSVQLDKKHALGIKKEQKGKNGRAPKRLGPK